MESSHRPPGPYPPDQSPLPRAPSYGPPANSPDGDEAALPRAVQQRIMDLFLEEKENGKERWLEEERLTDSYGFAPALVPSGATVDGAPDAKDRIPADISFTLVGGLPLKPVDGVLPLRRGCGPSTRPSKSSRRSSPSSMGSSHPGSCLNTVGGGAVAEATAGVFSPGQCARRGRDGGAKAGGSQLCRRGYLACCLVRPPAAVHAICEQRGCVREPGDAIRRCTLSSGGGVDQAPPAQCWWFPGTRRGRHLDGENQGNAQDVAEAHPHGP